MRAWVAGAAVSLALLVWVPAAPADEATTLQLNPAHTGYTTDPLSPRLERLWSVDLGHHVSYPVIADGRVFVLVAGAPLPGHANPVFAIFAFDGRSGRVLWRQALDYPGVWPSPLTYAKGRLFLATAYEVPEQHTLRAGIDAFDAATGKRLWRNDQVNHSWIFNGPPVAADGVVYATGAGFGGSIYAVRQSDGKLLWSQETTASDSGVAVSPQRVYAAGACHFWSFERAGGALAWVHNGGCWGGLELMPVFYEGRLFARMWGPGTGQIFDAAGGRLLGAFDIDGMWDPPPAFAGRLRVQVSVSRGTAAAFDLGTGARRWQFGGDGTLDSNPVIAGDTIYVGGKSGRVYGVDLASGRERWHADTGAPVRSTEQWDNSIKPGLAVGGGLLVVPATGRLVAYGAPSGRAVARVTVRCAGRCRARIVLKLSRRLSSRFRLHRAIGVRKLALRAGTHSVSVPLRRRAALALAGRRRVRVTAVVSVRAAGEARAHRSRQLVHVSR
jgi:outer membrane protein assembly factor BamB